MTRPLTTFQGGTLYLDAMILVGLLRPQSPWHAAARELFQRAIDPSHGIRLLTATLTVDELILVLLQELLLDPPYSVTRSRSQHLSDHPATVQRLMQSIEPAVQGLLEIVALEPLLPQDIDTMRHDMVATGLLPRDAIHIAVMRRLGLSAIASDDALERCAGVTVFRP